MPMLDDLLCNIACCQSAGCALPPHFQDACSSGAALPAARVGLNAEWDSLLSCQCSRIFTVSWRFLVTIVYKCSLTLPSKTCKGLSRDVSICFFAPMHTTAGFSSRFSSRFCEVMLHKRSGFLSRYRDRY